MASFSIGEAYGAGFGLIARRPLSVLIWGLVTSVLRLLPVVLMFVIAGPGLVEAWGDFVANTAAGGDPEGGMRDLERSLSGLNAFQALEWLFGLLATGMMSAAVFRAMLRPEDGGVFGLKVGMDELWQILVYFVSGILTFFIAFFAVLVFLIPTFMLGLIGDPSEVGSKIVIGLLLLFLCIVTILWFVLRFSMAGPATFATRSFQFFESWTLTKGNSWKLVGLALLLGATVVLVEVVLGVIFFTAFISAGALESLSPEAIEAFFSQPFETWMVQLSPWLIGATLLGAVLSGAFHAFLLAPFASVYRQLTRDSAAANVF